ncbi:MAG TPA: indolepyruvate ferredoxin oxidoreductase family protein [Stellaceae bacterium]|jgi:indolepyruvate ferredoxin oxidoreductase|nr:indolepyruvate ferredoxin oxidoreductase family protein [Stellaceae bacterium]
MAQGPTALAAVSLDDKYSLERGRVYLTGTQALVRLPMLQRQRDAAAGLNTACFIAGYRGSPLGGFDQALWNAKRFVERNHIEFQPAINEEIAATAVWGSQQVGLFPGAKYDGVFAMWYGKGPGVDRSGDALKHGNSAGTAPYGGVLVLAGDDHTCKSSTLAHQSEFAFIDASIPILNPAGIEEILDLGLYGWAMSRFSGCWVGFKTVAESMDSSASIMVDPERISVVLPEDFAMPPGGLNIRWPDMPLDQELRLHRDKLRAVLAFARANRLDRIVLDAPQPRFGIATTGKSYLDVRQALDDLGIGEREAAALGVRLYKVAMPWPLEPEGARAFAEGLDEILVVEEKRAVLETQLKEQLFNWPADRRPRIIGKYDEAGNWILPSNGELGPSQIARIIAQRLLAFGPSPLIAANLARLDARERPAGGNVVSIQRTPYFCSGCPHNSSTKVPEGSRALAGIGCHWLSQFMDRDTATFTQMGGEGAPWIGQAPFTETTHVFANIGDGTYTHSGVLAIRAAVAAKVNMTYKVLFNDAVAMTGGQPLDGSLTVPKVVAQLAAEGVGQIVVVSDEPDKYPLGTQFAPGTMTGTTTHHRDDLDAVQRDLREVPGVTAIVYDQTCAAEKRRRRKRGRFPDPPQRVVINDLVCEGCGDCSATSNCLSVVPIETEFGRKRTIDQSSCNKDFSCLKGFCPSFVTVQGGSLRKRAAAQVNESKLPPLPDPVLPEITEPFGILVTGVGGTGVVTIGALIGMAAHLEGKGVTVLDMTGMAQKGGAVLSHVRIADQPEAIHAVRLAGGGARLLLGCDLVVSAGTEALSKLQPGRSRAIVNSQETITGDFTRNPDMMFPGGDLRRNISTATGQGGTEFIDATRLATGLLGDSIATNLFMLGYAYQQGLVPVSAPAIDRAIELNGVAIAFNRSAFEWGRRAAIDRPLVEAHAAPADTAPQSHRVSETLDEALQRRTEYLSHYQNAAYAARYAGHIRRLRQVEAQRVPGSTALTDAAMRGLFKVMAYKDEYEVARLYTDGDFAKQVAAQFEGDYELRFHLAPPLLAERDPSTGHLQKRTYGPWMLTAFKGLARLRGLRGTPFDPFGRTAERRAERRLIGEYETLLNDIAVALSPENHAAAVELARLPLEIRGFGHVKEASLRRAKVKESQLLARFRSPQPPPALAAAE